MSETKVTCINCSTEVAEHAAIVDRQGQFPELMIQAQEEGKEKVVLCKDCYGDLSDDDEEDDALTDVRKYL